VGLKVRKRDSQTRKVVVLETRYETEGEPGSATADLGALSASLGSLEVVEGSDDMASQTGLGLSSSTSFGRSYEDSDDPYAWAQRLRDIPDKVNHFK
jgi:hypothetical protein